MLPHYVFSDHISFHLEAGHCTKKATKPGFCLIFCVIVWRILRFTGACLLLLCWS